MVRRLISALDRPVDAASVAAFRIAFGAAMVIASLRFFVHGWIDSDYRAATHFFPYWGLSFIRPWPGVGMTIHYMVMAASASLVMLGLAYRSAAVVFALTFTYAHLCDKSNYLNHYYLVSLIALLFVVMPLDREWSLRVMRRPADRRPSVRAWVLYLLRFQVGLVYVFGGVAKIGGDWLLHAEPLRIWLMADADLPILRHVAAARWLPFAMSWCGMLFDLTIVAWLSWSRTRRAAYVVVLGFHAATSVLFHIGMFPVIMSLAATLFFDPAWPRRLLRSRSIEPAAVAPSRPLPRAAVGVMAVYAAIQIAMPLRHFLYPGNTLWTEEGFRFSWRVMLIEKSGDLEYTVIDREGHAVTVSPHAYLTPFQTRQAATQPDMILQLAHMIAEDFDHRGRGPVQVYANAQVSWNGRLHAPIVDPRVDLAQEHDGLAPKSWILPAPTSSPRF